MKLRALSKFNRWISMKLNTLKKDIINILVENNRFVSCFGLKCIHFVSFFTW